MPPVVTTGAFWTFVIAVCFICLLLFGFNWIT